MYTAVHLYKRREEILPSGHSGQDTYQSKTGRELKIHLTSGLRREECSDFAQMRVTLPPFQEPKVCTLRIKLSSLPLAWSSEHSCNSHRLQVLARNVPI